MEKIKRIKDSTFQLSYKFPRQLYRTVPPTIISREKLMKIQGESAKERRSSCLLHPKGEQRRIGRGEEEEEKEAEEGREAKYGGGGWEEGGQTSLSGGRSGACGVRGRSGGRSIMMQRWRGCGTLELARALAIGRSANHSFGNNRLHTLHTKDIHASLSKNRPDPGAASPPISTYDPETSSISPSTNPLSSLFHFRFQPDPDVPSLSTTRKKESTRPHVREFTRPMDNNDLSSPILSNLFRTRQIFGQWNRASQEYV